MAIINVYFGTACRIHLPGALKRVTETIARMFLGLSKVSN